MRHGSRRAAELRCRPLRWGGHPCPSSLGPATSPGTRSPCGLTLPPAHITRGCQPWSQSSADAICFEVLSDTMAAASSLQSFRVRPAVSPGDPVARALAQHGGRRTRCGPRPGCCVSGGTTSPRSRRSPSAAPRSMNHMKVNMQYSSISGVSHLDGLKGTSRNARSP